MIENITVINTKIFSISPLCIGDKNQEPLIYDNKTAYIPATTIAGAFKGYLKFVGKDYIKLFGEDKEEGGKSKESSVIVKDSYAKITDFDRRNGIAIEDKYGISKEGSKFERIYIREGLKFELGFKIQGSKDEMEELKDMLYACLKALDKGIIRLGGNKSNGLGVFKVQRVEEISYDLTNIEELTKYLNNNKDKLHVTDLVKNIKLDNHHVMFKVKGKFTTPLIIKGVERLDSNDVDGRSIGYKMSDDKIQYIIPGSSFKGVLRSRIEKIANYFGTLDKAKEIFGELTNKSRGKDSILSRVFVLESTVEEEKGVIHNRTKIDRFTGGVMNSALMNDFPIKGRTKFNVMYRKKGVEEIDNYSIGLIALALRDLGTEDLPLGGNSNIGRGRFEAESMVIDDGCSLIEINFIDNWISDEEKLNKYIKAVNSFKDKEGGDE